MTKRLDIRSAVLGGVVSAGLVLTIGAVREQSAERIGRFQVAAGTAAAYVVDTATGQVWYRGQQGFLAPKLAASGKAEAPVETQIVEPTNGLDSEPAPAPRTAEDFIGRWVQRHPTEGQVGVQIEADGKALLTEGQSQWQAEWRLEGERLIITTEEEEAFTARINAEGQLLVSTEGGSPLILRPVE